MSVNRSRFIKWAAAAAVALGTLGAASSASAGVDVSFGIALPGVVIGGGPSYYAPAPVYTAPPPVYYNPQPIYNPPPVYYRPPPVYYQPAPVYYGPPSVTYYGGGYYRQGPPRGYGHGEWRGDGGRRDWR